MFLKKAAAFIKRDFLTEISYKSSFLMNVIGIFFSAFTFFFIAKLFGKAAAPHLQEYGGDYFPFVLIGIAFVPGSCIYNLLFPNSTLHQKFGVEPFFLKLVLYPIISLAFLGSITLIFDKFEIQRELFSNLLFLSILILYVVSSFFTKPWKKKTRLFKLDNISLSKYTAFIIYLSFCVIIIAFGLHTHTQYLQES